MATHNVSDTNSSETNMPNTNAAESSTDVSEDPLLNDEPDPAAPETPPSQSSESTESDEAQARIEALEAKVEALEAERDAVNEKFLRKAAELENVRKRLSKQAERQFEAGKAEAINAVLGTIDDLQRSMNAAEEFKEEDKIEAAYRSLHDGLELVHTNFLSAMGNIGVERIEAEGQPFDEQEHDAMMQQPAPEGVEPGTVLHEVRAGYRMGDRVIRHAQVVVAK